MAKIIRSKPLQNHHFATNKRKKYTPQIESVTKKYGLNLNGSWNKELLPHQGRHPNAYHDYVLSQLRAFDRQAKGNKKVFLSLFEGLKKKIRNNPSMMYKEYWRGK
ncbi:AHH domain-containing protein [Ureibacillus composti]